MAQLAVAVVGGVIGFMVGGPAGAQVGFALGSAVGSTLGPGTTTYGPRLSDLKVQVSSYGQSIPRGFGGFPAAGNVIWSTAIQEQREEEEVGKGGPSQTQVTYTYSVSCAIAICEGPIAGVRRIWADSKLVYDARDDADADTIDASGEFAEFFTLYLGTEDQTADPTMEAALGAGEVPAYRGTAYIVFTDLPLADYGNRLPNFLFEVFTEGAGDEVQGDGVLCHFDELNGDGDVISEIGPDFIPLENSFLNSDAMFGDNSAGGGNEFVASGITGSGAGRSWRVEWFYKPTVTANFGNQIIIDNPDTTADITIGGSAFSPFTYNITCAAFAGGGGTGSIEPTLNAWNHVAIQYRHDTKEFAIFNGPVGGGGAKGGVFSTGQDPFPISEFGTGPTFSRIRVIGAQTGVLMDELFFQFDPDTLYGDNYTIPTAPFSASGGGEIFTPGQVFLPDVVEALCLECGLEASEIDVTDLPNTEVLGYTRARQMPGRAAIDPLRQAFWFDAVESDGKVKFVPRGGSSLVTIDDDDLGAIDGENDPQPATEPVRAQEAELPAVVNVAYLDRDVDYENGAQTARRVVTGSVQQQSIELPIVLTHQHAADSAAVLLYDAWTARTEVSWSTTKKYAKYEPTDIVTLVDGAITRQVRITDKSEEGPVIKWKGRDDRPAVYDPNATPSEPTGTGAVIRITGDTVVELIDSPIFLDANDDPGFYVAARGTRDGWTGGVLYQSTDGGTSYASLKTVTQRATMGYTLTELGNWTGGYVVDETNTVDVQLDSGTLASITRDSLLDSGQAAIIGNEVVGFQRATLIGDDQYRLSGLLRGMSGTEDQITEHTAGDRFVLISEANWYRADQLLNQVGVEYLYKPVTFGKSIEAASSEAFTNTARGLKPLAPVDLRCSRNGTGAFGITWARRSRLETVLFGASVPLGEASEAYEVDILDGADVVRTLSVTEESADYTAAHQIADFGAVQTSIDVAVYQVSASVGRGFPLTGTLSTSYTPAAQSNTITLAGTFAAGVPISVYANGLLVASRTSISGDTNINGIATALASSINAHASYSASAIGPVITVTGNPGATYTLTAIVGGSSAISVVKTQDAALAGPGEAYEAQLWISNFSTGVTEPIPAGVTFTVTVKVGGLSIGSFSFTTTASVNGVGVLSQLAGELAENAALADYAMTLDSTAFGDYYGVLYGPVGTEGVNLQVTGSAPWGLSVSVQNPGSGPVAEDTPQVVDVTVTGTPANGEVFRVTLGGENFTYTATVPTDTREQVIDGLVADIDSDLDYSAAQISGTKLQATGAAIGDFSYTASITRGITATVA